MEVQPQRYYEDPEAVEGTGLRLIYNPRCEKSVQRTAERLQRELALSYLPTLASPSPSPLERLLSLLRRG